MLHSLKISDVQYLSACPFTVQTAAACRQLSQPLGADEAVFLDNLTVPDLKEEFLSEKYILPFYVTIVSVRFPALLCASADILAFGRV